jgi:thioredoxin reductase
MAQLDVIVIGGGLHGCSAALHRKRSNFRTLVMAADFV